jgi:BlaI family transcriptional regulator, penicillinase repressor
MMPMSRKRTRQEFTPLELEIMHVLWATGPANVAAVQEVLPGEPPLAYTTVQTMLNILHRKGKVKRVLKGRAYEYAPAVSRERAAKTAVRDMIDRLFGGSAESLVMSLIEQRQLTPAKLAKLNRLVAAVPAGEDDRGRS